MGEVTRRESLLFLVSYSASEIALSAQEERESAQRTDVLAQTLLAARTLRVAVASLPTLIG